MKYFRKKSFTIIELLVVIAIIAVLASIVWVNVVKYVNRGKISAIMSNLSSELSESVKYYSEHGNYSGWCDPQDGSTNYGSYKFDQAIIKEGGSVECYCNTSLCSVDTATNPVNKWCVTAYLPPLTEWNPYCVDSSGAKILGAICVDILATCQ